MNLYKQMCIPVVICFLSSIILMSNTANAGAWRSESTVGGKLKTHVYVPTTTPALNNKRALMVSIHGCGQTHTNFKDGANWPATADAYGMVVALPLASKEGLYGLLAGCWNFHGGMNNSRDASDVKYLINMVDALVADASLNIDANQVYITGLSSGAGQANLMACLAPDVFAGVGINAGPAPGSGGTDLSFPSISVSKGKSNCNTLAGSFKSSLYSQLYNNVHGTSDSSVSPSHATRNTEIFEAVYEDNGSDITACGSSNLPGGGDVTTYCDGIGARISKVLVNGMPHAWPAGPGSSGGGNYIDHTHINYPNYISDFFFTNNRRVSVQPSPTPDPSGSPTPTVTPTPTPTPACSNFSTFNSYHYLMGRATKTGLFFSRYYAKGSNDNLGSSLSFTTVYSYDGSSWNKGSCP